MFGVYLYFTGLGYYKIKVLRSRLTGFYTLYGTSSHYCVAVPALNHSNALHIRYSSILFLYFPLSTPALYYKVLWLQSYFCLQVLTLSFTGKGYKLVKNRLDTLTFSFGHSHIYYIYSPSLLFRFRTKTRGYFLGLTRFALRQSFIALFAAKPLNIFTHRGVRARKQCVFKKVGKLSLYM